MRPGYIVILSYLAAAFIGTVLLSLPAASTGDRLEEIDAFFTATSAICVTGLIVVDTGTQFTVFGKSVVLALIQLGGLGVMTFSIFLFLFIGKGLGIRQRWIITESFTPTPIREISRLIRSIFVFTFSVEAIGAIFLFVFWRKHMPVSSAIFTSVFHSISAFCNAGFSFFGTSFISFRASAILNITILALIVIGGIGFPVIYEFMVRFRQRRIRRLGPLSLHTRMVLWTTVILILAGGLFLFLLERNRLIAGLPWNEKIFSSLFQSITARTAGFNTLDISTLSKASLFIIVILMFFGASPGSCGGGIKTTSLAVLAAMFKNRIWGTKAVSIFHRSLPMDTISRTLSIFILAVITITTGLILLLVMHMGGTEGDEQFLAYLFEAVSAFGTVGLSMGVTSTLTTGGKIVIIFLMLIGRVGLLTIAYVVTARAPKATYQYAEERVMIG
jgi:trk system potassium uptake protein TrkH